MLKLGSEEPFVTPKVLLVLLYVLHYLVHQVLNYHNSSMYYIILY